MTPEACRQAQMQRLWFSVAAVSNIQGLAESSRRLPGWPWNNAAHLEAAPPGSG